MIQINVLTKIYKLNAKKMQELKTKENTKVAVNNVSLEAKPGEIFGLRQHGLPPERGK